MTIYLAKDGSSMAATNAPSEIDGTNLPGLYKIVLTTSEMTCDSIAVGGKSTTLDAIVIPVLMMTEGGTISSIESDISTIETAVGVGDNFVSWTYTLRNSLNGDAIPDCRVSVSTDVNRTNVIRVGYTDNFGHVTFSLEPGTYYIWRSKARFTFDDPDIEVVS